MSIDFATNIEIVWDTALFPKYRWAAQIILEPIKPSNEIASLSDLIQIQMPIDIWTKGNEDGDASERHAAFAHFMDFVAYNAQILVYPVIDEVVDLDDLPIETLLLFWRNSLDYLRRIESNVRPKDYQLWQETDRRTKKSIRAIEQAIGCRGIDGFVYLLKSPLGRWKIGKTINPADRIKTFSVKLPFEVEYEHLIPCDNPASAEKHLHDKFAGKRTNGEWFALAPEDVTYIKSLNRLDI